MLELDSAMLTQYLGSCLCKALCYQIQGKIGDVWNCYCTNCRKAHGAAYATHASINKAYFSWLLSIEKLRYNASSTEAKRFFCGQCGSQIYMQEEQDADSLQLVVATLDTPLLSKPIGHIFTDSKACWVEISGRLPQFEKWPPKEYFE